MSAVLRGIALQPLLTHVRSKDIGVTTVKNFSLEVRREWSNPSSVVLQRYESIGRESTWLKDRRIEASVV